jgi:hypothetical protein
MIEDYPTLNSREKSNLTGTFKNGKLESIYLLRDSGRYGSHLQAVLSHIKNANPNNPDASKGMGKAAARRAIEVSRNGGKTMTIEPDTNATDFWRNNVKDPVNGMITIKPPEYEAVMAKLDAPKIENSMEEELTSYVEPLRKDKIMKEFGSVGDVSTATYGGTEGQNYKKKIGGALHFKARGVEGVFDVMKSVKFEDING